MIQKITWILCLAFWLGCKPDAPTSVSKSVNPDIDATTAEIKKDPKNANLYFQRAQKYYEIESFDASLIDIKEAIKIDSLNPAFYHLLSDAYLDNFNSDEAIMSLYKVLKLYPNRVQTMLKLSELKYIIEDYDGSILVLNEILKVDKQNAEAYYMLGVNFKVLNDIPRATNAFQTATEMDSKLTDAWINLGEIHDAKKDPKAIKFFENAIISNPNSMTAKHAKAFYLQNQNKIAEAKNLYREIIVTDRNYQNAYLNLGLLYMDEDSIDKAYEQFNNLASVAPTNHKGFYFRAMANEKRGKTAEAINDLKSARNLKADDPKVTEALKRLEPTK